jgi:transcriptional regulator with XRE-family HTH domain
MENFGERLRRFRTASRLSTSDLAFRIGVTEGAIRQLESGRTKSPSFSIGLKLAEVLDVDPWLLSTGVSRGEPSRSPQSGSLKDRVALLEARVDGLERQALVGARAKGASRRSAG